MSMICSSRWMDKSSYPENIGCMHNYTWLNEITGKWALNQYEC